MVLILTTGPAWGVTVYRVFVLSSSAEDLAAAQTVVPDAFLVAEPQRISILAGTFINRVNAEKRQAELERLGLNATITTATETEAPLEPVATPSPAPQLVTSPTPVPTSAASQPTIPPATSSGQNIAQRPFAVVVLNPTNDEILKNNLRRFFPNAVEVTYQQQPALITGSFSQQAQAQQQTQWLNAQGFGAVVISTSELGFPQAPAASTPTSTPTAPTSTPIPTGEQIWVLVADPTGERLAQIQQLVPEAIPLIYDGLRVVNAGGYPNAAAAQNRAEQLTAQGYEVGLFPADLERAQPIFAATPGETSPAPPAPPPSPAPTSTTNPTPDSLTPVDPETDSQGFWVLVPQPEGSDRLGRVQSIAPDAFERRYQDQPVIQMGTYRLRESAEQAIQDLDQLGLPGRIVPL